jgi:farnesyl-diphosphate farnesyltransferase
MSDQSQVLQVLEETSRTFYIPIIRLPENLQETIASAYLCMRAIDEIEDHKELDRTRKSNLLRETSQVLQSQTYIESFDHNALAEVFNRYENLPEVTIRLGEWACHPPEIISPRIWEATSTMADRMAYWVDRNWDIKTRSDLDSYTYSVAGAVGLLVCDIWAWYDGSQIDRVYAIQFGRGLQSVNILRNRSEDLKRGVDYFPSGWLESDMFSYAWNYLDKAKSAAETMPPDPFHYFVEIPLILAKATLSALEHGEEKLSRNDVLDILQQIQQQ